MPVLEGNIRWGVVIAVSLYNVSFRPSSRFGKRYNAKLYVSKHESQGSGMEVAA